MNSTESTPTSFIKSMSKYLILPGISVFFLVWLVGYSSYGLDLTDEGFYLLNISNPFEYSATHTQFGFIVHPFYQLLSGDIASLRILNILTTFGLAFVFLIFSLRQVFVRQLSTFQILVYSFSLATLSLLTFITWKLTPNYNSLNFQAILLLMIGLVVSVETSKKAEIIGAVLVGLGGWMAFMVKPTSALLMVVLVPIYLIAIKKFNFKYLLVSIGVCVIALTLSMFLIDGSIQGFVTRLQGGLFLVETLSHKNHGFDRLLRFDWYDYHSLLITSSGLLFVFVVFGGGFYVMNAKAEDSGLIDGFFFLTIIVLLAALVFYEPSATDKFGFFAPELVIAIPFSILVILICSCFIKATGFHFKNINFHTWMIFGMLALMPYLYAFGAGSNYSKKYPLVVIFWVLACLVLVVGYGDRKLVTRMFNVVIVSSLLVTIAILKSNIQFPPRHPPGMFDYDYPINIGVSKSELVLDGEMASYLIAIQKVAGNSGFSAGMPLLDFTGQSPGVVYALGGRAVGVPWMIGSYQNSEAFITEGLRMVDCRTLASAWLITEPLGPRAVATDVLDSFGANLERDYLMVGGFVVPAEIGAKRKYPQQQYLFKPIRESTDFINECQAIRHVKSELNDG